MAGKPQYLPGAPAPVAGNYEQLRMLGSPTGVRVAMLAGQPLPAAPIGSTWIRVEDREVSRPRPHRGHSAPPAVLKLRAEAAAYRRMAATAQTPEARNELEALAARLAAAAAEFEAENDSELGDQPNGAVKLGYH